MSRLTLEEIDAAFKSLAEPAAPDGPAVFTLAETKTLILNLVDTRTSKGMCATEEEIVAFVEKCTELALGRELLEMLLAGELSGDLVEGELSVEMKVGKS